MLMQSQRVLLIFFMFHKMSEMSDSTSILTMSLLPFWALNVIVALLSMEGQKALGFH